MMIEGMHRVDHNKLILKGAHLADLVVLTTMDDMALGNRTIVVMEGITSSVTASLATDCTVMECIAATGTTDRKT